MSKQTKPPEEYPATYAPRARIVCAASFAAWQDGGGSPHLDQVIVGTPLLASTIPQRCPLCDGQVEVLPPPATVTIGEG